MRIAIFIAAGLEIVAWLMRWPALFGNDLSGPFGAGYVAFLLVELLIFPALAIAAFVLAYKHQRLRLAAILVLIEPVIFFLGMVAFGFGVAIKGF
jgi:hypothetical protein